MEGPWCRVRREARARELIDTGVVDSLKVLDPDRPIREADIRSYGLLRRKLSSISLAQIQIGHERECQARKNFIGAGNFRLSAAFRDRSAGGPSTVALHKPHGLSCSLSCTINGSSNMKAARIHRFGAPDVVVVEEVPRPAPAAGELLIRVAASGVDHGTHSFARAKAK